MSIQRFILKPASGILSLRSICFVCRPGVPLGEVTTGGGLRLDIELQEEMKTFPGSSARQLSAPTEHNAQ